MKKPIALFLALAALWLGACKNEPKERFLPPSTGGVNSLMVVMDTELWQGPVGDKIREEFAAQVLGLPQAEPLFSITQVPPRSLRPPPPIPVRYFMWNRRNPPWPTSIRTSMPSHRMWPW